MVFPARARPSTKIHLKRQHNTKAHTSLLPIRDHQTLSFPRISMDALRLPSSPQPSLLRRRTSSFGTFTSPLHRRHQCRRNYISAAVSVTPVSSDVSSPSSAVGLTTRAPSSTTPLLQPLKKVSPESLQVPSGQLVPATNHHGMIGEGDDVASAMEYLTNILSSKVYEVAEETPLQLATKLSERLANKVWLKREDLQPVSLYFDFIGYSTSDF